MRTKWQSGPMAGNTISSTLKPDVLADAVVTVCNNRLAPLRAHAPHQHRAVGAQRRAKVAARHHLDHRRALPQHRRDGSRRLLGDDSGDLDENTLRKLVGDDTIVGGVWGDEGGGSGDSGDGSGGLGDGDGGGGGDGGDGDESGDKSLTDKVLDYVKENPLTTALLATTLVGGLAGGQEQTQETTSTPVKKTYTYGAPGEIKQTGLQQLFDASKSIYTPYTVPAQQQQQIQVQQPNMGPLLSGQAPGGYGLGSLTKQVGAGQAIDISQLTPEQLYQLQSMLGPGV